MPSASITTGTANSTIVRFVTARNAATITTPSGHTEIGQTNFTGSFTAAQKIAYTVQAIAGASGTATFVADTGNEVWSAVTIAIEQKLLPIIN